MKKFNSATENRFDYLKVVGVDVFVKSYRVDVKVIYPEEKKTEVIAYTDYIVRNFREAVSSKATVDVTLTMSHFDLDFFKTIFLKFFSDYPSVDSFVFADNLSCEKTADGYFVKFLIERSAYDYITEKGIDKKLDDLISSNYCEKIVFEFVPVEKKSATDSIDEYDPDASEVMLLNPNEGRYIIPENVEQYYGPIIYERAEYISDCFRESPQVVVCGKISRFTEMRRKPKDEEDVGKTFYKFTLEDFTGRITCLIFPKKNSGEKVAQLHDGNQVVVRGKVVSNEYRDEKTYSVFVSDLSLCTLPAQFEENRFIKSVEKDYKVVFPKPYVEKEQIDLFAQRKETPSYLLGKTFVVFDLETTGTQIGTAKITQVAGLKIVDGVFKETFESFVNPHEKLSERIVSLTDITDEMLATAPEVEPVLDDFRKFSDGAILVGHNIKDFDVPILNDRGKKFHIEFNNEIVDTLPLSHSLVKGLNNYKLKTITEFFGYKNEHEHRADADVLANARVFVELARLIK